MGAPVRAAASAHHPSVLGARPSRDPRGYPQYRPEGSVCAIPFVLRGDPPTEDVHLGTHVQRVAPDGDSWRIDTGATALLARVVIFATGRYREPVVPTWSGRDQFQGRLDYIPLITGPAPNSPASECSSSASGTVEQEIAADLAEQRAAHGHRRADLPPIMPRDLFGIVPAQVLGLLFTPIPAARALGSRRCLTSEARHGRPDPVPARTRSLGSIHSPPSRGDRCRIRGRAESWEDHRTGRGLNASCKPV